MVKLADTFFTGESVETPCQVHNFVQSVAERQTDRTRYRKKQKVKVARNTEQQQANDADRWRLVLKVEVIDSGIA